MSKTFSKVENGEVVKSNIKLPFRQGNTFYEINSDISHLGFYEEIINKPPRGYYDTYSLVETNINEQDKTVEYAYEVVKGCPDSISARQAKQQLVISGLDESAENAIASIEDLTEKKLAQIWYNSPDRWERKNPYLNKMAESMGLTQDQLDDLFVSAVRL